jgi:hypothetical protein
MAIHFMNHSMIGHVSTIQILDVSVKQRVTVNEYVRLITVGPKTDPRHDTIPIILCNNQGFLYITSGYEVTSRVL